LWPRVPSTARQPNWTAGFKAEAWNWGFAAAILGFAITLKLAVFFIVTAVSVGSFWILTSLRQRK
jgi:hypothetical protein